MNQNIWGPHLWFILHTITINYPLKPTEDDKKNYKNFFLSLEKVIPCNICKKNYKRHIKEIPIDDKLNSRKDLFEWMVDMHNVVNGETGKKILSYKNVINKYEDAYEKKNILEIDFDKEDTKHNNKIKITFDRILIIVIIILILYLLYYINKNYKIKIKRI